MTDEQLSPQQTALAKVAIGLLQNAGILLREIDEEIQAQGSTGENQVNQIEWDLKMICDYIQSWIDYGIDI